MTTKIFVNLPVKDLDRAVAFYTQVGYSFNPRFTDQNATCMIVSDDIYVMLLVEPFFQGFTNKPICDAHKATEVLLCVSADNRAAVDALVGKAIAAGANAPNEAKDYGFMYQRDYEDLDGHIWSVMYMDPDAPGAP